MILSVQNISKTFGDDTILDKVSFHVEEQEKAALVGINGAGKSTLFKIIMNELSPDEGSVTVSKDKTVGYLAQHQEISSDRTVYEEVLEAKRDLIDMEAQIRDMEVRMQSLSVKETEPFLEKYHQLLHEFEARNGYAYTSEVTGILKGLGFEENDFNRPCKELSGGQKTRVALARLLVTHPDLILLDEPTNHLDIASITWLETFLRSYRGAVLVIAHDRYFLDRVVTKVVEIHLHQATVYHGNYSYYVQCSEKMREERRRAYINQQRKIRHQQEVIDKLRSFNREKSIRRAESRQKLLDKMATEEKPQEEHSRMKVMFVPSVPSGKDVLSVQGLSKSFGEKHLFDDLTFEISRGEHVALIGENGTGKTTILKIINQLIDADSGMFVLGANVRIGYYDQEQHNLDEELTLYEEIANDRPDLTQTQIRNVLASFLFTGDDVFLSVEDLSGGERARLSLAKLMLSEANFLILDEPTNHLDIISREILESALNQYEGTVLFVSHDRYFINRCASRVLNLENGHLTNYLGNYDYFVEKREEQRAETVTVSSKSSPDKENEKSAGRSNWERQKEEQARQRKKKNRIDAVESEITELETDLERIDLSFSDPEIATDASRLESLHEEQVAIREKLDSLYAEWEELAQSV